MPDCLLHFEDAGELWAWLDAEKPTVAVQVTKCPHCGFDLDQPEQTELDSDNA